MNSTLHTLLNHRSIRKFKDQSLNQEQISTIIQAAQMASSSSYMQAYSIIGVTDPNKKQELADITGQDYVKNNGHLMIFCADLFRIGTKASESQLKEMKDNIENTEHFLVATVDASLAAQNAAIAAESMGLGICYIGSIRNQIQRVDELLSLPMHVIPLFGMVIGYPDHIPNQKPRLPQQAVYFNNEYNTQSQDALHEFDKSIQNYYRKRTNNERSETWSEQMIQRFSNPIRMDVTTHIRNKNLNKR